jgi:hypothetical protein
MSLAAPNVRRSVTTATEARALLVEALVSAGLNAVPVAPDSPTAGAAWPQWTQTTFDGHLCDPSRYAFSVYVVLEAGDASTTVAGADAAVTIAAPALNRVADVQAAEPVLITFGDSTTMPGVRIRVITRT